MKRIPLISLILLSFLFNSSIGYSHNQASSSYFIFLDIKVKTTVKNIKDLTKKSITTTQGTKILTPKVNTEVYDPVGYLMSGPRQGANFTVDNVQIIPRNNQKYSVKLSINGKRYGPMRTNCKPVNTTRKTKKLLFNVELKVNKINPSLSKVKCSVKAS